MNMDAGNPERALAIARVLDAALRCINDGISVFPAIIDTKLPATPHGFKDATTDETQVRAWFGNGRRHNLAAATGAGRLVLDVDVKHRVDGFASLAQLEAEVGSLNNTRTAATPSGGQHRWFTVDQELPSSAGLLGPGLDIRCAGGYVILPPSVIDGAAYTWEDDGPMRPLPDAVVQRLLEKRTNGGGFHEFDGGKPVPIGQQETVLNMRACSYRRIGMSQDSATLALWNDVQAWPQDPAREPWALADVESHVARAWRDIEPGTREAETLALLALVKPHTDVVADAAPHTDEPRMFSIADARLRLTESVESLPVLGVDGYIVRGWSHLLAGWWRLGKTEFLAAVVAVWLRLGVKVLWITEEPDSLWADRADNIDEIYEPVPWDNLALVDAMSAAPKALLKCAADNAADVLIVDTVREVCRVTSMKDDDAIRSAVSPWLRRLKDGRRTLIFVHQHRKAAGEHGERVEGHVALPSMFDAVLELEAVAGHEQQRKLSVRRRGSRTTPLLYEMDDDDRLVVIPDGRARNRIEVEAAVLSVVDAATTPLSTAELRRRMTPTPPLETTRRVLLALATGGVILRNPPITEDAKGHTVTWLSTGAGQLTYPQKHSPIRELAGEVGSGEVGVPFDAISGNQADADER